MKNSWILLSFCIKSFSSVFSKFNISFSFEPKALFKLSVLYSDSRKRISPFIKFFSSFFKIFSEASSISSLIGVLLELPTIFFVSSFDKPSWSKMSLKAWSISLTSGSSRSLAELILSKRLSLFLEVFVSVYGLKPVIEFVLLMSTLPFKLLITLLFLDTFISLAPISWSLLLLLALITFSFTFLLLSSNIRSLKFALLFSEGFSFLLSLALSKISSNGANSVLFSSLLTFPETSLGVEVVLLVLSSVPRERLTFPDSREDSLFGIVFSEISERRGDEMVPFKLTSASLWSIFIDKLLLLLIFWSRFFISLSADALIWESKTSEDSFSLVSISKFSLSEKTTFKVLWLGMSLFWEALPWVSSPIAKPLSNCDCAESSKNSITAVSFTSSLSLW